jgi:HEAT repeat protein
MEAKMIIVWLLVLVLVSPVVAGVFSQPSSAANGELAPFCSRADELGPEDVSALIHILERGENSWTQRDAICALGKMGGQAVDAAPALVQVLWSSDPDLPFVAANALGDIGPEAVLPLIQALEDGNERVRWFAAYALGRIGPDAGDAIPALARVLEEERNHSVREAAAEALEAITVLEWSADAAGWQQ